MSEELNGPAEVDWEKEKQRILREIEREKGVFRGIDPDIIKEARLKELFEQLKTIEEAHSRKGAVASIQGVINGIDQLRKELREILSQGHVEPHLLNEQVQRWSNRAHSQLSNWGFGQE